MSADSLKLVQTGWTELRKRWGWFVTVGLLMIVLGSIAIGYSFLATLATMVFIGWLMIMGGVLQTAHAFSVRSWSGFFFDLISGILYSVVGFFLITSPAESSIVFTLLLAVSLIVGGIFRVVAAVATQFPHWGWLVLHGLINVVLGVLIWRQWPLSGLWVIGLFTGIDMFFSGWTLLMLGLGMKSSPTAPEIIEA